MTNLNDYARGKTKNMTKALLKPRESIILTIDKMEEVIFNAGSPKEDKKLKCHWVEDKPPLVLNKSNVKFLLSEFGPEEADYCGRKVEVWHDPTVEMSGQLVGGLKLRLPRGGL